MQVSGAEALAGELERLKPAELLVNEDLTLPLSCAGVRRWPPWQFDADSARRALCSQFGVHSLDGFGCNELPVAVAAAGCLLAYVQDTQRSALPHLTGLNVERREDSVILDAASRRNLELEYSLAGRNAYTLAGVVDHCLTPMGSRLLRRWLNRPLRDQEQVQARQNAMSWLLAQQLAAGLRAELRGIGDVERMLARVALKSARPRDLTGLRQALGKLPALRQPLTDTAIPLLSALAVAAGEHTATQELLVRALVAAPPAVIRDGGMIATGYDAELDELRNLSEHSEQYLLDLEARERARTGLSSLKVGYNRVHGFYIEISRVQALSAPSDYQRRQTLKGAERYITPELKRFEDKVLSARERALAREKLLYDELLERLIAILPALQRMAAALAELDVLANLADRAQALAWTAPQLVAEAGVHIDTGRHPVVEQVSENPFVPNDLYLNDTRRMLMITGPNMGGKSTFMRQTALIVILAHIGSFVPAARAVIGPIDRIFTRIGAADDLASGRSTFMVEMTETANILHNATAHSLVLMDEIGRGTSTFDGLALAWACAQHLIEQTRAFTLFATHYFELTRLPEEYPEIANVHLDAIEHGDAIVFMHKVQEGPADRSYGLHVAALAGIPPNVVQRAKQHLKRLERQTKPQAVATVAAVPEPQLSLFAPAPHPALVALTALDPDALTPRAALDVLYQLKALAGKAAL